MDNNSSDETCSIITRMHPTTRLVQLSRNVGLSAAFNIAWHQVSGHDVLFINPDVTAQAPAVAELERIASTLGAFAALAPRLLNTDGTDQHTARSFPTAWSMLARRTLLGKTRWGARLARTHLAQSRVHVSGATPVDWALGAALLIPSRALHALQGFDSKYFLYCEDVDFCSRGWRLGLPTYYYPDVAFKHEYQRASRRTIDLTSAATRAHIKSTVRLIYRYPQQFFAASTRPSRDHP